MNKKILSTITIILLLITGCASNSATPALGSASSTALPVQARLILGTLKLEETANAITSEQAADLLPMWYVLKDLNSSVGSAQEEIDGLVTQIQSTLTKDQIQAIADMKLGVQDLMAAMQVNGDGTSRSSQTGASSSAAGAQGGGAGSPPADMPLGGMPAGGGDPGGSGMAGAAPNRTTPSANSGTTNQTAMSGVPSALFDAVIKLLEVKVD